MADKLENLIDKTLLGAYHEALMHKHILPLLNAASPVEGYLRVAGSSFPALSFKHYEHGEVGKSCFSIFYPCLVGTKLTGPDSVGHILHRLQKLGARTEGGVPGWLDVDGTFRRIDGSEGDLMIVNVETYYELSGRYTVDETEYDVFIRSLLPFEWDGYEATEVPPFGESPDYCVLHSDSGVNRMHSVYNPDWNGSYQAQQMIVGAYVYSTDPETGEIIETYDANAAILDGAGGMPSTNIALYDGEQYAMNQNPDTTKPYPFYNATAHGAELLWGNLAAEGGTFDSHKKEMFGSGFSANDAADVNTFTEAGPYACNGCRVEDKDGNWKYFAFGADIKSWTGKQSAFYPAQMLNDWRNPFRCNEAYRALCHAVHEGVHELEFFEFEGHKYKWRSVQDFDGPSHGEATAVVFKYMSSKLAAGVVDPTDKETSIEGNRIDFVVSVGLYHGRTTQVSPSWWTSGMIMTEDENGQYKCYIERDQTKLIKSENGEKAIEQSFNFETAYTLAGTYDKGEGYRKNYSNDAFMLPDTNANKSGAGLHTYVCAYNYFNGSVAGAGKKVVRGFRRGYYANNTALSPLCVAGHNAPSHAPSTFAFGTCVQIVTHSESQS